MRKLLPVAVGVGALLAATTLLAGRKPDAPAAVPSTVRTVKTATVQQAPATRKRRFFGVTRAERRATLAFTLGGRVIERPVEVGQRVTAGQLVARMDPKPLANAVASARATLGQVNARVAQSRRDQMRAQTLLDRNAATREEVEKLTAGTKTIVAGRSAARAGLREAQRMANEGELRAPFDGTIVAIHLEAGEFAGPGQGVVRMVSDTIEVVLEVSESVAAGTQVGDKTDVWLPLLQQSAKGRVIRVGHAAEGPAQLFPVTVGLEVPEGLARSGITVEASLEVPAEPAVTVPISAIVDPTGRAPALFAIRNGHAQKVAVTLGQLVADRVAVKGPLKAGEAVVVGGHFDLLNGDAIETSDAMAAGDNDAVETGAP